MNIEIIDETENYWIINKPAHLSVHPGAGDQKTFTDIWTEKFPKWANISWPFFDRPGIIHRLDKDTTGVMLVAKNLSALNEMQTIFSERKIHKIYRALVVGDCDEKTFIVEAGIARDKGDRKRQATALLELPWEDNYKTAKTTFKLINTYTVKKYILSEFECFPETGRMHQIRVHLKLKNLPLAGDNKYSNKLSRYFNKDFNITRQMLHAYKIDFIDPWQNKNVEYTAQLPEDYLNLLDQINK